MYSLYKQSLYFRTMFLAVLLIGIVCMMYLIGTIAYNAYKYNENLQERAALSGQIIADNLSRPLWNFDSERTTEIASTLEDDPDYIGSEIYDTSGNLFAKHDNKESYTYPSDWKNISILRALFSAGKEDFTLTFPILKEGSTTEILGNFKVKYSKKRTISNLISEIWANLAVGLLNLSIILTLIYIVMRKVLRPLKTMTRVMTQLSKGDHQTEIPCINRIDEVGQMAHAVEIFKKQAIETENLKKQQEIERQKVEQDKKKHMNELAQNFDGYVGEKLQSLLESSTNLNDASQTMKSNTDASMNESLKVKTAASETSQSVSVVSSATEEMNSTSIEISRQVAAVVQKAKTAAEEARATSEKVNKLNNLAENIGEVVTAISDISERTNLLALNATIEAARAGEAGKGFTVVADEVKTLANEAGEKTEEIRDRILEIQNATRESVQAMQSIINDITDIDETTSGTAAAIEEQASAIQEITRNISEVANATKEVSMAIENVQSNFEQTNNTAISLGDAAGDISNLADNLNDSVKNFLDEIRS